MTSAERFFVAVVSSVAVGAVCYLAMSVVPAANAKSLETWAEVFAAIGTLAAVIVALYLGRDGQRRLERADSHRATLAAAKVGHLVATLSNRVDQVSVPLTFGVSPLEKHANVRLFVASVTPVLATISDDDLIGLMPLPGHVGGRLASVLSKLRVLCASIGPEPAEEAVALLEAHYASQTLFEVGDALRHLSAVLQERATGAAPDLTLDERYGGDRLEE